MKGLPEKPQYQYSGSSTICSLLGEIPVTLAVALTSSALPTLKRWTGWVSGEAQLTRTTIFAIKPTSPHVSHVFLWWASEDEHTQNGQHEPYHAESGLADTNYAEEEVVARHDGRLCSLKLES